jgi:hypothetical protein
MQLETDDLETLLDMYAMWSSEYYTEVKALEDELTFRKTLLGKELR